MAFVRRQFLDGGDLGGSLRWRFQGGHGTIQCAVAKRLLIFQVIVLAGRGTGKVADLGRNDTIQIAVFVGECDYLSGSFEGKRDYLCSSPAPIA